MIFLSSRLLHFIDVVNLQQHLQCISQCRFARGFEKTSFILVPMLLVHFGPSFLGCDIDLTLVMERTGGIGQGVGALLLGLAPIVSGISFPVSSGTRTFGNCVCMGAPHSVSRSYPSFHRTFSTSKCSTAAYEHKPLKSAALLRIKLEQARPSRPRTMTPILFKKETPVDAHRYFTFV